MHGHKNVKRMYFNLAIQRVYMRIFYEAPHDDVTQRLFPGDETVCVKYIGQRLRLHHQW
jgi:hypothetical protein